MLPPFTRLVRIASLLVCVIVCASFLVFAVDQTGQASNHQQQVLQPASEAQSASSSTAHEAPLHRALDDAAATITSPFSGLVASISSEWASRGVRLLLALLVYGLGVGYLVRVVRVRV